jgi:hypothetical protein
MSDDDNEPKIVYTIPYYDYLRFERWKFYFWVLLTVTILTNIFYANLGLIMAVVPRPILNQILGITPEMQRNMDRNEAISKRYERWQAQEKVNQENLAKTRQQAYFAEEAKKYKIEHDQMMNAPVSEETAKFRAFH